MGLIDFFKKLFKKDDGPEFTFNDPELDIESEYAGRGLKNQSDKMLESIENLQHIRTHCDQISESGRYIEELKAEYAAVNNYIDDVRTIEELPKEERKLLGKLASDIHRIEDKKENYRHTPSKLTPKQYDKLVRYEEDFPKALYAFQNDEKYLSAVKHDMRMLESEKLSLREDIENYRSRRNNVKTLSIVSLFGIIGVFVVFFISGVLSKNSDATLFMVVLLLVAIYVFLIFLIQRNTLYKIKISESKLARAITLLNKTKIKYVNIMNSVDYQCSKYKVKNSYELIRQYEAFLEDKKRTEKYQKTSIELTDAQKQLEDALTGLKLNDESVWEPKISALYDPKEMNEFKKKLSMRRQKLKDRIEYNFERIEEDKKFISDFIKRHPKQTADIMDIVSSYNIQL